MNWFYAKNGSQQGPLSTDEIKSRIAMGEIGATDLAWSEGMADWMPVGQIPQLKIEAPLRSDDPAGAGDSTREPAASPYQSAAAAPASSHAAPGQTPAQGMAIGALVCGILGFIGCCAWYLAGPLALVAVILGHVALGRVRANPAAHGGQGMARVGLILGYLGLLAAALFAALTIKIATMSPQEQEEFILKWVPEEQRQEVLDKLKAEREKLEKR